MATLALSLAGQFAGGLVGGPIGATVGRALGALAGSAIDGWLFGDKQREQQPFDVRLGGSVEGAAIPRLYGWGRLSGNIIWARELERLGGETAGAKGTSQQQEEDEIGASFAIAFCEGRVTRLGRVWADGQLLDLRGINYRFYAGSNGQMPDGLIEATQGSGNAPAYRGLCYMVFENLPISRFGNRIPQISAELCRPVGDLETSIRAVTVIPGATEFGYDPVPRLRLLGWGTGAAENTHVQPGVSDWTVSINELQELCPNLKHVSLVVSWFGDDLRCGSCQIGPRIEAASRDVQGVSWSVAGYSRGSAPVVSNHGGGPAYGGTPSDAAVRAAIADLRARGLSVTLYPLIMMDVPVSNGRPDPYGAAQQASYPWRGRITCHPAAGFAGSPDGTAAAASQVAAFLPGYRAMILHYAQLAAQTGVEAFLIGSEMRGMTTVRGAGNSFPFVSALVALAADVRAIVGPSMKLSYAADWSEYSGHQPGGGEKFFHLDPLWASANINAVGIDCYMPAADWRDGEGHLDAAAGSTHSLEYLQSNIAGGEGFDWYYASDADRAAQMRSPIVDGAHGEHWIWRYKDISAFWSQYHHDRPGGVRAGTPTAWVPGSKPIWMTELGCAAVDKGANQPNIFGDAKSSEGGRPYFSNGLSDPLIQRQFLRAHYRYWGSPAKNPAGMVDPERIYCWTWDARPYPAFPALTNVWADGVNHATGHWLTGRLGAMSNDELASAMAAEHGAEVHTGASDPMVAGVILSAPATAREALEPLLDITGQRLVARGGVLAAISARGGSVTEFEPEDLAQDEGAVLSQRRAAAVERPGKLALSHFDKGRDYLTATATAVRPGAGQLVSESVNMVLDGASARLAAERLLDDRAASVDTVEFSLPPNLVAIEPGDRVVVGGEGPYEITEIRDGAVRRVTARTVSAGTASATRVDRAPSVAPMVGLAVAPVVFAAHLPPLAIEPGRSRLVFGAYAKPWPGAVRLVDTATGAALLDLARAAALGEVVEGIGPGPVAVWDRGADLSVRLYGGHIADGTEAAVLAGSNRLAVETDLGTWEVIGFAEAELVEPGLYRLTRLLRGLEGTDGAIGTVSPGRRVVVLDGKVGAVPVEAGRLGEARDIHAYAGTTDLIGQVLTASTTIAPGLPLAPVHLRAQRAATGDIAFSWIRRSRAEDDAWGAAEPALDNAPESYRLSIFDGSTFKRSFEVSAPLASYGAAEQIADFGGPATSFRFSVAQVSAALGAGHAAEESYDE